tara:strand:+ start:540 stop:1088 length:549 start_codon:yes stop_codon:yes gene_type:complete
MIPKKFYFIDKLTKINISNLDNKTGIIYRNYKKKIDLSEILNIKKICKKNNLKFYISNNIKLALALKLDGAYIPSFNNDFRHLNYSFNKNLTLLGSAHNIKEIKIKELQNVKIIFLSSIFKKNSNYLGINKFKVLGSYTKKKVIALGGVSESNFNKLKLLGCYGFAGISYFRQKKGPNKGAF